MRFGHLLPFTLLPLLAAGAASAQTPVPMPPAIAAPQDVAFPGTIELNVDATDTAHAIFRVHERIPVAAAGPMTLLFPLWLPGDHQASGQLEKFTGLVITANGAPVAWRRDAIAPAAFHVDVPGGARALDLSFVFVSATDESQGPVSMTSTGMQLEWNSMLLYPAGYYATRINFAPHVTLPSGWGYASALGNGTASSGPITFAPIDLSNLADSPLFAGINHTRIDLDPNGRSPVFLNIFADRPDQLHATDAQIAAHRRLVQQADRLFGARHFDHYDFLLTLSDRLEGLGLEHHRSSENGTPPGYFAEWDNQAYDRDLLAHEMTHSWNGKYRRPADLWTPNFNEPMRGSLLWVYEGQTEYWGNVLAARSGMVTRDEALGSLARTAAYLDAARGRTWRPLEDTTLDPIIADRPPQAWRSFQRSEDYYREGQMIWLDVDTLIRERTHNAKSLDTFARAFFGGHDGEYAPVTYTFDDIVAGLNAVMPYDWASFLRTRLDQPSEHAPLDGLTRGGYRLVFTDTPSTFDKSLGTERKFADFLYSLGFSVSTDGGQIAEVMWDSPAFNAGMTRGAKLIAVNGEAFDADALKRAITAAKTDTHPIELLLQTGSHYQTVALDYHSGLRYPHLERIPGAPDRLGQILAPR